MTEAQWIKNGYDMGVIEADESNCATFSEVYESWFLMKRNNVKPETLDRIECTYNRHFAVDYGFIESACSKMDEVYLIDWLTKLIVRAGNIAKREFDRIYQILHGVLVYAHDMGEYGVRLIDWGKIKRYMPQNNILPSLNQDECIPLKDVNALFKSVLVNKDYTEKNSACMCLVLNFFLGLRLGELSALTWTDVDLNNRVVHVTKTEVKYIERSEDGKRQQMVYVVAPHTKTKQSMRVVPLCDGAVYILTLLKEWHKLKGYESPYLAYDGGQTILSRSLTRTFAKLCKINDLPAYNTHKIRKTYASFLHSAGVPIKLISDLCGHTEVTTTAKYYIRSMEDEVQTIGLLNGVFNKMVDLQKK